MRSPQSIPHWKKWHVFLSDFPRSRGIVTSMMLRKEKKQKLNKNWKRKKKSLQEQPFKVNEDLSNKRTKKKKFHPLGGVLKWKRLHQRGRMKKWWRQRINRNGGVGAKKHDRKQRKKALQGLELENRYHRHQETESKMQSLSRTAHIKKMRC